MDFGSPRPETDSDQVDPGRPRSRCDAPHVGSLGRVDGVDGITRPGHRPHLNGDTPTCVEHEKVDLPAGDGDIPAQLDEPVADQPPGGESLTRRTDRGAAPAQSFSSVFSSFSTFTSRNVRTWTCSRNRAGRNMSHTQASLITTSK